MIHKLHLNEEPFEKIKKGSKTVEMRLLDEKRKQMKIGDEIEFINRKNNEIIRTIIVNLHKFPSFKELYKSFDKEKLGYSKNDTYNYEDMTKYYSKEEQEKCGVVGIEIKLV